MLEATDVEKIGGRPNNREDNPVPLVRKAGLYLGVAFELPGTILGGLVLGYLLDEYFASSPWLLIGLGALAFIGAFARLVRWVKFFNGQRNGSGSEKDDPAH
jgi:F0F1-type ATP synthase assembly protein I